MNYLLKSIQQKGISVIFTDIRFWILFFFILRLFNINSPIFDSHNWRQSDGYAIARNFFEIDANILYPRVDHAGNLSGIMGSEFPIMNYLVHWLYVLFDVDWWQGRLLNLVVSSIACYFFYKTIFLYIKKEIALTSTLFLIASLWFSHSRKFMPDVFSSSLVIIAIYFGWTFLKTKQNRSLIVYFILISFGLLSKLPAFVITAFLAPAIFNSSIQINRKIVFVAVSILAVLPSVWWYFYWAPKLTLDYGYYYFFMGSDISTSLSFLISEWQNTLSRYYSDAIHYVGFLFYILGVIYIFIKKEKTLIIIFSCAFIFQVSFMLKGGETFAHHTYYIISFVPIMVVFAAYFTSLIKQKWLRIGLVSIVVIEGVLNLQHDFMPRPNLAYRLDFENISDKFTKKQDLIAVNNDGNPALLYFAHRKGWTISSNSNDAKYEELYKKGCKLIIWDKHNAQIPNFTPHFIKIEEYENYAVYRVE